MYNEKEYMKQYYLEHAGRDKTRRKDMDMKGKNGHGWKGGKTKHSNGYVLIWVDSISQFADMRDHHNYIFEHRLVMAQHLGRYLEGWEHIHHINGIKTDNRVENLRILCPNCHSMTPHHRGRGKRNKKDK